MIAINESLATDMLQRPLNYQIIFVLCCKKCIQTSTLSIKNNILIFD